MRFHDVRLSVDGTNVTDTGSRKTTRQKCYYINRNPNFIPKSYPFFKSDYLSEGLFTECVLCPAYNLANYVITSSLPLQLFPVLWDVLCQPLVTARDRYEAMKEAEQVKEASGVVVVGNKFSKNPLSISCVWTVDYGILNWYL